MNHYNTLWKTMRPVHQTICTNSMNEFSIHESKINKTTTMKHYQHTLIPPNAKIEIQVKQQLHKRMMQLEYENKKLKNVISYHKTQLREVSQKSRTNVCLLHETEEANDVLHEQAEENTEMKKDFEEKILHLQSSINENEQKYMENIIICNEQKESISSLKLKNMELEAKLNDLQKQHSKEVENHAQQVTIFNSEIKKLSNPPSPTWEISTNDRAVGTTLKNKNGIIPELEKKIFKFKKQVLKQNENIAKLRSGMKVRKSNMKQKLEAKNEQCKDLNEINIKQSKEITNFQKMKEDQYILLAQLSLMRVTNKKTENIFQKMMFQLQSYTYEMKNECKQFIANSNSKHWRYQRNRTSSMDDEQYKQIRKESHEQHDKLIIDSYEKHFRLMLISMEKIAYKLYKLKEKLKEDANIKSDHCKILVDQIISSAMHKKKKKSQAMKR